MGSTLVRFRDSGFEANDAVLEIWLLLLVEAIDQLTSVPEWLSEARAEWQLQATAGFGFGVDPGLDEIVTSEAYIEPILALCERAMQRLRGYGDIITCAELNQLSQASDQSYFTRDCDTRIFLEAGEAFMRLLRESSDPKASQT